MEYSSGSEEDEHMTELFLKAINEKKRDEETLSLGAVVNTSLDRSVSLSAPPILYHGCRVISSHHQLRLNLVLDSSVEDSLMHNADESETETFQHLPVLYFLSYGSVKLSGKSDHDATYSNAAPLNLDANYGLVAACASGEQLFVCNSTTGEPVWKRNCGSHRVGYDLTNCIRLHRPSLDSSDMHVLVAGNELGIEIFSIEQNARITALSFPTYMNEISVAPDGENFVALGDTDDIFMCKISGDKYERTSKMEFRPPFSPGGGSPGGFCADWSADGSVFAVLRQAPGAVNIWQYPSLEFVTTLTHEPEHVTSWRHHTVFYGVRFLESIRGVSASSSRTLRLVITEGRGYALFYVDVTGSLDFELVQVVKMAGVLEMSWRNFPPSKVHSPVDAAMPLQTYGALRQTGIAVSRRTGRMFFASSDPQCILQLCAPGNGHFSRIPTLSEICMRRIVEDKRLEDENERIDSFVSLMRRLAKHTMNANVRADVNIMHHGTEELLLTLEALHALCSTSRPLLEIVNNLKTQWQTRITEVLHFFRAFLYAQNPRNRSEIYSRLEGLESITPPPPDSFTKEERDNINRRLYFVIAMHDLDPRSIPEEMFDEQQLFLEPDDDPMLGFVRGDLLEVVDRYNSCSGYWIARHVHCTERCEYKFDDVPMGLVPSACLRVWQAPRDGYHSDSEWERRHIKRYSGRKIAKRDAANTSPKKKKKKRFFSIDREARSARPVSPGSAASSLASDSGGYSKDVFSSSFSTDERLGLRVSSSKKSTCSSSSSSIDEFDDDGPRRQKLWLDDELDSWPALPEIVDLEARKWEKHSKKARRRCQRLRYLDLHGANDAIWGSLTNRRFVNPPVFNTSRERHRSFCIPSREKRATVNLSKSMKKLSQSFFSEIRENFRWKRAVEDCKDFADEKLADPTREPKARFETLGLFKKACEILTVERVAELKRFQTLIESESICPIENFTVQSRVDSVPESR